jgi:prepilin-type processing-associated H-X9-DG protein
VAFEDVVPFVARDFCWDAGSGISMTGNSSVNSTAEMLLGVRERLDRTDLYGYCNGVYHFSAGNLNTQCDMFHFWSLHAGGAHFAFCDGLVRLLSYSADPILPALATRAGGEAVSVPD